MFQIQNIGLGPGEYLHPADMVVLPDESILLFDQGKRSLIHYSSKGEYVNERRWGIYSDEIAFISDNRFLVYAPDENRLDNEDFSYLFFNMLNNRIDASSAFLKVQKEDDGFYEPGVMSVYKDTISFIHGLSNLVYQYASDKYSTRFEINFGSASPPEDLLENGQEFFREEFYKNNYAGVVHQLNETKDYFTFNYHLGERICWVVYSKKTGKSLNLANVENDIDGGGFSFPISTHEDFFIGYLDPHRLKNDLQETGKTAFLNGSGYRNKLINMLDTINDYDNPIIFGFRLRSF